MATYNGEKYIKEQLDSILSQLGPLDEVIISDDHSIDNTLNIIYSYNDPRIIVINNTGKGVVQNFENAIKNASGKYIFLSDQDDIWVDDKIKVCQKDFDNGFDLVLSDCSIFDSESKATLHDSFFNFNGSKKGILKNFIRNSYIGCCMAFNSEVKNRVLPFPENIPMHDSWIGIISEIFFNVSFNDRKLVLYRQHSGNASYTASGKSEYVLVRKMSFRIRLVYSLTTSYLKYWI